VFGKVVNWNSISGTNSEQALKEVKEALNSGDRLVFGVLMPRLDLGTMGAVARHKTWFFEDTWVLTPEILNDVKNVTSGHAMVITGYDDNAIATDSHGNKHKGLLTLRNSWGSMVGNYGEFYMSYDYFKLLSHSVVRYSHQIS
jgi:aminopeptidase C